MVAREHDETSAASELIDTWIEPDPNHPGAGDVRLREHGVHVWAVIAYLQAAGGDIESVAEDFDVPIDAVRAAKAYYERYADFIEDRLAANRT